MKKVKKLKTKQNNLYVSPKNFGVSHLKSEIKLKK